MLLQNFSPEIAIPAIKPYFPGAVFQKELLTIILLCRVLMQPQKLKQKLLIYSGGKVKYLKQALTEKNNANSSFTSQKSRRSHYSNF